MDSQPLEEWQFWELLSHACIPLRRVVRAKERALQKSVAGMSEFSDAAYVHRVFDLWFHISHDWFKTLSAHRLTDEEKTALRDFEAAWKALPWRPIESHPHISDLAGVGLDSLVAPAKKLDRLLALRTANTLVAVVYRCFKGWKKKKRPTSPVAKK